MGLNLDSPAHGASKHFHKSENSKNDHKYYFTPQMLKIILKLSKLK